MSTSQALQSCGQQTTRIEIRAAPTGRWRIWTDASVGSLASRGAARKGSEQARERPRPCVLLLVSLRVRVRCPFVTAGGARHDFQEEQTENTEEVAPPLATYHPLSLCFMP